MQVEAMKVLLDAGASVEGKGEAVEFTRLTYTLLNVLLLAA